MEKIKQFVMSEKGMNVSIVLVLVLVAGGSFWLGRLSVKNSSKNSTAPIVDTPSTQTANVANFIPITDKQSDAKPTVPVKATTNTSATLNSTNSKDPQNKPFFASSRGTKYYSITGCSGGKTISPENKIYFYTLQDAEKAGYVLSSSCKK